MSKTPLTRCFWVATWTMPLPLHNTPPSRKSILQAKGAGCSWVRASPRSAASLMNGSPSVPAPSWRFCSPSLARWFARAPMTGRFCASMRRASKISRSPSVPTAPFGRAKSAACPLMPSAPSPLASARMLRMPASISRREARSAPPARGRSTPAAWPCSSTP